MLAGPSRVLDDGPATGISWGRVFGVGELFLLRNSGVGGRGGKVWAWPGAAGGRTGKGSLKPERATNSNRFRSMVLVDADSGKAKMSR